MDLFQADKEGKKLQLKPSKGIYLLKDDVLMICYTFTLEPNAPRPERFTTAAKSKTMLLILRRGK